MTRTSVTADTQSWLDPDCDRENDLRVERAGDVIRATGWVRADHAGRCSEECDCGLVTLVLRACVCCDARCDDSYGVSGSEVGTDRDYSVCADCSSEPWIDVAIAAHEARMPRRAA